MKITSADLENLRAVVAPLDTDISRGLYRSGAFPRADACKDRDKRYRWDLLHASGFRVVSLYDYLDDTHIDTALRSIVPPLA